MESPFTSDWSGSEDDRLDRAFLMDQMSLVVPETPSPLRSKTRRSARLAEDASSSVMTRLSAARGKHSHATAGTARPAKRRKVARASPGRGSAAVSSRTLFPDPDWLDDTSSSSSSCSSSSASSSSSSTSSSTCSSSSASSSSSSSTSSSTSSPPRVTPANSLSFLTVAEKRWLRGECGDVSAAVAEHEVVLIDDDDDHIQLVCAAQMEEDEAFARSLQAQFDQEEAQLHQHHHQRPRRTRVDRSSPPGRGRRWRTEDDFSEDDFSEDDFSEDDYEALLALEEQQGAVVSKKLTREHVLRFPIKRFQSGAGNAGCQICFGDYDHGERLRMLPCFHDYHVACIDRWLQDNTTCPICRVDLADL
ncbi:E3 ubiquitin-protein ligase RNF6 [Syngnathus typhle]|uniref:E3 ubiquitin-protein ligase RNF6 n=1 Tax=Syngnathus typhle TaxID=161592 RepID=UPI002A69D564|nr:E3 ubiquitin-protein ligase RNF6 [Syngnathus typhle]